MMNTPPATSWIQYWKYKPQARMRLFCFPYAGGSASLFRTWSVSFPAEIEVCPVQLPGREQRLTESAFTQVHALVETMVPALLPYLNMPYALFGHSMGALICFEFARALRSIGREDSCIRLFASAHRAPHLPGLHPPVHQLLDSSLLQKLRYLRGTPEAVLQNAELLELLLPHLRADFTLCEAYSYRLEAALSCPISTFGGLEDKEVTRDMVTAWREHTSRSFKVRFFTGDHFFIHQAQAELVRVLAQELLLDLQTLC